MWVFNSCCKAYTNLIRVVVRDQRVWHLAKPRPGNIIMQVVSGTLALLVAALTLCPDRQPPIMTVLLMLLIEVQNTSLFLKCGIHKDLQGMEHEFCLQSSSCLVNGAALDFAKITASTRSLVEHPL